MGTHQSHCLKWVKPELIFILCRVALRESQIWDYMSQF